MTALRMTKSQEGARLGVSGGPAFEYQDGPAFEYQDFL